MKSNKILLITTVLLVLSGNLFALEPEITDTFTVQGAYSFDNNYGWGVNGGWTPPSYTPIEKDLGLLAPGDNGRNLGSGWGGAGIEALYKRSLKFPFLQGEGALLSGNNIKINLTAALNPISLRGESEVVFTPVAFLQFALGGSLGSGWDAVIFNGVGLNTQTSGEITRTSFGGAVLKTWIAGTFQFDLEALVPGEWNHILLLAKVQAGYQHYTGALGGQAWQWQADGGENFNTFNLTSTYFLGYQMPMLVDTVGVLLETNTNLEPARSYSTINSGGWGSDFVGIVFGPLVHFQVSKDLGFALLLQVENYLDYTDATIFNKFYGHRSVENLGWRFKRLAFNMNWIMGKE